jgi:hypothetical protein
MGLITAAKLLLKGKKSMGVIKTSKGGVEAITGVAPKVSKELSEAASARRVMNWAERMKKKLKE